MEIHQRRPATLEKKQELRELGGLKEIYSLTPGETQAVLSHVRLAAWVQVESSAASLYLQQ